MFVSTAPVIVYSCISVCLLVYAWII